MATRLVVVTLALLLLASGCSSPTAPDAPAPAPALTPARKISGVWATTSPVTFIHTTDFCNRGREIVGRSDWNVTWTITAVSGFSNVVDVEMRFTRGSTANSGGCGGSSGYVPLVSPSFFRLCISSTELTRCSSESYPNGYAFGSFTADQLMLTWSHWECLIYCFGEYTEDRKLAMFKRS